MRLQVGVRQRLGQARQRVVGRHRVDEAHRPQRPRFQVRRAGRLQDGAQGQVGLAGGERAHGAAEDLVADAQACRRLQPEEVGAQLHQRRAREHAVDGQGELRLPARGHAPHAVHHGIDLALQPFALGQQLSPGGRGPGLAGAAVEQQHIQRVLDLAHAVGQGAGHQAQLARGAGEVAGARDRVQDAQRVGGENVARVLHDGQRWIQIF